MFITISYHNKVFINHYASQHKATSNHCMISYSYCIHHHNKNTLYHEVHHQKIMKNTYHIYHIKNVSKYIVSTTSKSISNLSTYTASISNCILTSSSLSQRCSRWTHHSPTTCLLRSRSTRSSPHEIAKNRFPLTLRDSSLINMPIINSLMCYNKISICLATCLRH